MEQVISIDGITDRILEIAKKNPQCEKHINLGHYHGGYLQLETLIKILDLENITSISLYHIKYNVLAKIVKFTQLKLLSLRNNNIEVIPKEIGSLSQLETISLNYNNIKILPDEICNLTQLKCLYLFDNKITDIPINFYKLTNLEEISLSRNQIKKIPSGFFSLLNLNKLCLSNNLITTIPKEILQLINLHTLYLDCNCITALPTELFNLTNLQTLSLSSNNITHLANEISNMRQLRHLQLSHNKLTSLPISIIYLSNLRELNYAYNEITNFHPALRRFLNGLKNSQSIYDNNQNVHNHNIEHCINTSIKNFVLNHKIINVAATSDFLINELQVHDVIKNLLKQYCKCDFVHSVLRMTFEEVAISVLDYIITHDSRNELERILSDEMNASINKCFQGRLSRLINTINGYHPDININISINEQIANIIILTRQKLLAQNINDHDALVKCVKEELHERNFTLDIINEWVQYIDE